MSTLSDLSSVITKMKQHFAVHGIPSKLLTDNGPQFASREFKSFASQWSFEHVTNSPYFPQSNGFAENAVKQAKSLLEKCKKDDSNPLLGLLNLRNIHFIFHFIYLFHSKINIPRDQVLVSPAQWIMSRCTRCVLPVARKLLILKADNTRHVSSRLRLKNQQQKSYHDQHSKPLLPLHSQQVVQVQTERVYQKVGVVNPLHNHGRTLWNLKERSTVKTEDISCLFQNRLLLNVPADYEICYVPSWYHLVYSNHLVPSLL